MRGAWFEAGSASVVCTSLVFVLELSSRELLAKGRAMRSVRKVIVMAAALMAMTLTPITILGSSASAASAPIKIALVSSLTGPAASEFSNAARASTPRIALQELFGRGQRAQDRGNRDR